MQPRCRRQPKPSGRRGKGRSGRRGHAPSVSAAGSPEPDTLALSVRTRLPKHEAPELEEPAGGDDIILKAVGERYLPVNRSGTPGHTASVWISNQKGHWEGIHWTRTPSSRKHSGSCVRPRPEIRRAARQACNVRVAHARVARRTSAQPLCVEGGRGLDVAGTRARRVGCQALRCDHPAQPAGSDPPLECPREDAYRPTL